MGRTADIRARGARRQNGASFTNLAGELSTLVQPFGVGFNMEKATDKFAFIKRNISL